MWRLVSGFELSPISQRRSTGSLATRQIAGARRCLAKIPQLRKKASAMRSTARKGAGVMVRALENEGVDFGAPGRENLDFLDALRASRIRLVVTRHEQVARASHPAVTI